MAKTRFTPTQRQQVVSAFRDFAQTHLGTTDKQKHLDFANTVINGNRQNLKPFVNYLISKVQLPAQFTTESARNLIRRAVGKGSLSDGTSPELINYFNGWVPQRGALSHDILSNIARRSRFEDVQPAVQTAPPVVQRPTPAVQPAPVKRVTKAKVVVQPTTTAGIIHEALSNARFTAIELLTHKFTVIEFLDRIGVEVKK